MDIKDYLYKKSTKPIMTICFQDRNISGKIYGICTPKATLYKYSISMKNERLGRSYSMPVEKESWTSKEIVEAYKKKGWEWSWICPCNGYEIDCLTKEEPFKELPKGEKDGLSVWRADRSCLGRALRLCKRADPEKGNCEKRQQHSHGGESGPDDGGSAGAAGGLPAAHAAALPL